jgi:hypothetical protein
VTGATYQRSNGNSVLVGYALRIGFGSAAHAGATSQTISNAVLELELDKLDKKALSKYHRRSEQCRAADDGARCACASGRSAGHEPRRRSVARLAGAAHETARRRDAAGSCSPTPCHLRRQQPGRHSFSPELLARIKAKADVKLSGALLRTQLQQQVRSQVEVALRQQGEAQHREENIRAMSER